MVECLHQDEKAIKKKQNQSLLTNAFNVYNMGDFIHFIIQRRDIVQNLSCLILRHIVPKYILGNI